MPHPVLYRGRINLFADDVAIALLHLEAAFPGIMEIRSAWLKSSGLGRKLPKCSVVMGEMGRERYGSFRSRHPLAAQMNIVDVAVQLGVVIAPGAPRLQWASVAAKVFVGCLTLAPKNTWVGVGFSS